MTSDIQDLGAIARSIIDASRYLALGTADEAGRPWVSPVYYAFAGYREFFWVSSPMATHSRNIATRPEISIVVFDSRAPVGTGQGVYVSAIAEELTDPQELERGMDVFSRRSEAHGARPWTLADVRSPEPYRLYRATASDHWVLDPESRPTRRTRVTM